LRSLTHHNSIDPSWKIAPTGFFDPFGLSEDIDQVNFDQYRAAELKRVACAYVPSGVAAINAIPALGWAKMFFVIGAVDYYGYLGRFDRGMPDLGEKVEERKLQELQHGRLAVLAVLELLRHDSQNLMQPGFDGLDNLITGLPFIYK
jgi:hypothetical protein